jgi:hypothetical protein
MIQCMSIEEKEKIMKQYSQVRFAQLTKKPLITIWRWCRSGKIKTKIVEVENKDGKIVQTPLIPESELHKLGY